MISKWYPKKRKMCRNNNSIQVSFKTLEPPVSLSFHEISIKKAIKIENLKLLTVQNGKRE